MATCIGARLLVLLGLAWLALAACGCVAEPYERVALGTMGVHAVREVLGPESVQTADGCALDVRRWWPTVVGCVHVAVPETGPAESKLLVTGRVLHWITFQTLYVDAVYEGPLAQELLDGLRIENRETDNEFRARLVDFVKSHVEAGLTAKWKDPVVLKDDRYRPRFIGVLESCISGLRGRGSMRRERFRVDIESPGRWLRLRYAGEGVYRIEMHGATSLSPLPVL